MPDDRKVLLYNTFPCGLCRQAKALFDNRGVDYDEVNFGKDA